MEMYTLSIKIMSVKYFGEGVDKALHTVERSDFWALPIERYASGRRA